MKSGVLVALCLFLIGLMSPNGISAPNPTPNQINLDADGCCQGKRGNINCAGIIDPADLATLISYLMNTGLTLCCVDAANIDGFGIVDPADLTALISYLSSTGLVLPNCPATGPYATLDLSGTWQNNALASGPGAPWWRHGTFTFPSNGSFHSRLIKSDSPPGIYDTTFAGNWKVSTAGILYSGSDSAAGSLNTGHMDADKTVMVTGSTWTSGIANGTSEMDVFVKLAPSYSQSNLTGTWEVNFLASGPGEPWWERGTVTIAANGNANGILMQSSGEPDTIVNAPFLISSEGMVLDRMVLDSGKTVLVGTGTWEGGSADGTTELEILTKVGTGYSLADLDGTWEGSSLATGPGAPWRTRSVMEISPHGDFLLIQTGMGLYGVEVDTISGGLSISSSGIISIVGGSLYLRACLDAGKTVIVGTDVWTLDSPGTTELFVYTRMKK